MAEHQPDIDVYTGYSSKKGYALLLICFTITDYILFITHTLFLKSHHSQKCRVGKRNIYNDIDSKASRNVNNNNNNSTERNNSEL